MSRIRTIKPEAFTSETISSLSLAARWTFVGLWTHVDDEGRAKDNAKIIRGALWPNEDETVSSKDVEGHIDELVLARTICRYEVDGVRYLHVVNFAKHQKISHPTPSRIPPCPHGEHPGPGAPRQPVRPAGSGNAPEGSGGNPEGSRISQPRAHAQATHPGARTPEVEVELGREVELGKERECAALALFDPPEVPADDSAAAPPADEEGDPTTGQAQTAHALVGEWLEFRGEKNRPPKSVIARAGKELKILLETDHIDYEVVRQGFQAWDGKGTNPSAIASFVNEVQAKQRRTGPGPNNVFQLLDRRPSATDRAIDEVTAATAEAKKIIYGGAR